MSLIGIIVLIVVIGFAVWLLNFIPMDARFKQLAIGIIIFFVIIYLLLYILPGFVGAHPLPHGLR